MDRKHYLDLAREGVRLPIAAHLALHECEDPGACRFDGARLGRVIVETAERFDTPLAVPLMDLVTEKEWLLGEIGVAPEAVDAFHFDGEPDAEQLAGLEGVVGAEPTPRMRASLEALRHVAAHSDRPATGMCIGPFSLMTKLLDDPITAAYQVAVDPEDEEAAAVLRLMDVGTRAIVRWIEMQVEAGARSVCVCEPAYNTVYLSPKQIEADPSILDTLVLDFNRRIKAALDAAGADLILHDCGELNEPIIRSFNALDPAILSLGSPCDLPAVAHLVSKNTVLMGNLPSKKFYSDAEITVEGVVEEGRRLVEAMAATGHPFILATECDVLSVAGCEDTIRRKVEALAGVAEPRA